MSWRRVHRWLAIVLAVPLVVWSVTGLLFHLKPGWDRAYDQLSVEEPGPAITPAELVVLTPMLTAEKVERLEVFATAIGPLARVTTQNATELFDVADGRRVSPLSVADARGLALDAIARSRHRSSYGDVTRVESTDHAVKLVLANDVVVEVARDDAQISQRGGDTDRIDWLYRIHYLQWTGNRIIDRVLAVLGLVLIWAVLVPGVVLFVRRGRSFP